MSHIKTQHDSRLAVAMSEAKDRLGTAGKSGWSTSQRHRKFGSEISRPFFFGLTATVDHKKW